MRQMTQRMLGGLCLLAVSGCRSATRISEVPRVDLDLASGNRGYLVGKASEAAQLKTTRQIITTDVEIPSWYKPKPTATSVSLEPTGGGNVPAQYDTYVVQKDDSLWSIAAKKEIYGKASAWRRIFDANRDLLKSPERVRPGMTLKIPRGKPSKGSSTTHGDEGVTYKK